MRNKALLKLEKFRHLGELEQLRFFKNEYKHFYFFSLVNFGLVYIYAIKKI